MRLWAAQQGYANAIPQGTEEPRRLQLAVSFPDLPPGGQLYVDALRRLGFLNQSGIESSALTFTEIVNGCPWADETDRNVIKGMSAAYLGGLKMTGPFAKSPVEMEEFECL